MSRGTQSTVFGFNVESYQVFMLRHSVGRMVSERLPDSGDHHCPHWMARCANLDQLWDESVESGQITRYEWCLVYEAEEALEEVASFQRRGRLALSHIDEGHASGTFIFRAVAESFADFIPRYIVGRSTSTHHIHSAGGEIPNYHWRERCAHLARLHEEQVQTGYMSGSEWRLIREAEEQLEMVAQFQRASGLQSLLHNLRQIPRPLVCVSAGGSTRSETSDVDSVTDL